MKIFYSIVLKFIMDPLRQIHAAAKFGEDHMNICKVMDDYLNRGCENQSVQICKVQTLELQGENQPA